MGTWGMDIFDDDTSSDIIDEAMDGNVNTLFENASAHSESEYLEYHECHEVLVAAAILDSIRNSTKYEDAVEGYDQWISSLAKSLVEKHSKSLISSIQKVLSENSELHELWQENEDDYPVWRRNVENLLSGLSS